MKFIVFSDLHGRILLAMKLVSRFQKERGIKVDKILQCGDVGIFPILDRMDKATIRHAQKDPTELGFHDYFTSQSVQVSKIVKELNSELICVRGNHEDHQFLDELERESNGSRFFVDPFQSISICKSGAIQKLGKVNVMGIGRIGERENGKKNDEIYLQEFEKKQIRKSLSSNTKIDILISHDSARDYYNPGYGIKEIRDCLNEKRPDFHFFGHVGGAFSKQIDENGVTASIKVAELEFTKDFILPYGCMVFLDYSSEIPKLEVVEDQWLKEYQVNSWMYL